MARQNSPIEISNWVKGLITEASPLTYPENSSVDEVNFVLSKDGSRQRRFGMDFEIGSAPTNTTISDVEASINTFNWKNVGGDTTKEFLVIQIGNEITIMEVQDTLSYNIVHTKTWPAATSKARWSFTSVDGLLIVTTGEGVIRTLEFVNYSTFNWSETRLLVRDSFGVADIWNNKDLKSGQYIDTRPEELLDPHTYNLRNQTWGIPRRSTGETIVDPIKAFADKYKELKKTRDGFPSNSDQVTQALYADTEDATNRTVDRFHPEDIIDNPVGSFSAPSGSFIIDVLDRGASRLAALSNMLSNYPELSEYPVTTLPEDKTPGGATVVGEYAGRVWYSGFSGELVNGDGKSPRMSSYVLFSRVVKDPGDINQCYQVGDPTAKDNPDIVATDGGFIRIDGAYGISRLVNVGKGLMVVAENGVWFITGESGFSATNYKVDKITDHGIVGHNSLVVVDNTFIYWGSDGIYHVQANQYGEWGAQNITADTIQTFYDNISESDKLYCVGVYDGIERTVRWVYDCKLSIPDRKVKELVLDATLGAFYRHEINHPTSGTAHVVGCVIATPYLDQERDKKEVKYLTITQTVPTIKFAFSNYDNLLYEDWGSTRFGVDAEAYLLTGYISGGDFQRKKSIPSLTFHLRSTETGLDQYGAPYNPSSCKVRFQWDWTTSVNTGKWSREFQAYRKPRLYIYTPTIDNLVGDGHAVVSTKTTLRGSGRVFAMHIRTEPRFDCNLLGWSMVMGMNTNV